MTFGRHTVCSDSACAGERRLMRLFLRISCWLFWHEQPLHPHVEGCQVCGRALSVATNHFLEGGLK